MFDHWTKISFKYWFIGQENGGGDEDDDENFCVENTSSKNLNLLSMNRLAEIAVCVCVCVLSLFLYEIKTYLSSHHLPLTTTNHHQSIVQH